MSDQTIPRPMASRRAIHRIVLASSIGTVIEWYDFALYGAASALVFAPLFFPSASPLTGTLASFAVFAVAFFLRPIGGLIAAHIGDKVGRKPILIATVSIMGAATVLVGCLPTYSAIGVWAPVLLVVCRMLQGLGAGAEFAGAVTAVSEYTPASKRAFYTSFAQASVGFSIALSTGLFAILATLPKAILLGWAWRLPFLASALIFVVAIFIRRRIEETPEFSRTQTAVAASEKKAERIPLFTAIKESPRGLIAGILCGAGLNVLGYAINTFTLSYIVNTLHLPPVLGTVAVVIGTGSSVITVPLFGRLADRIGRRAVFAIGAALGIVFIWPYFMLINTGNPLLVVAAMTIGYGVAQSAMLGSQSAYLSELFETRYRFTGIAAAREINVMALGGTTPLIATALVAAAGGSPWLVAVFIAASCAVTLVSLLIAKPGADTIPTTETEAATASA